MIASGVIAVVIVFYFFTTLAPKDELPEVVTVHEVPTSSDHPEVAPPTAPPPSDEPPTATPSKASRRTPCMTLLEPFDPTYKNPGSLDPRKINEYQAATKQMAVVCPAALVGVKRYVLVDIGANQFATSVGPFQAWYKNGGDFIVHAFEPLDFTKTYVGFCKSCTYHRAVLGAQNGFLSFRTQSKLQADSYNAKAHTNMKDAPRDAKFTVPMIDIAEWVEANLSLETDFVVMKMDIEGAEWGVMEHMYRKGVWKYVDEFFFECHHAKMSDRYAGKTYADCVEAMARLRREESVAAHTWYL